MQANLGTNTHVGPSNVYGALAFEITYYLRDGVFRWYRYQNMDVIPAQVTFEYLALLLSRQGMQILAKVSAQFPIEHLAPMFRYPHHVVLAFPFRVT